MPLVRIDNLGVLGVVRDVPAHTLPPEAWSSSLNIRFLDGKAQRILGHTEVFDPPTLAYKWMTPAPTPSTYFWLMATLTKVHVWNGSVFTDITRVSGDYSATDDALWNGGLLGGVPIINNGVDDPQSWLPKTTPTKLVDLPNWPPSTTAMVMRPFGNFMVAMDVTKSGTRLEHMVKWSHPADPGAVPPSWDETDPTKDAGENDLTDVQAGGILEAWPLGSVLVIYKAGSVWTMQHRGGLFIFDFKRVFGTIGILATHCAKEIPRKKQHFVATGDDIVIHNGVEAESVIDRRMRKYLSNLIDTDNFERSYVVANIAKNEMWFCFPTTGNSVPDRALIWNYVDGGLTERDLPDASFISLGIVSETASKLWDAQAQSWDTFVGTWDESKFTQQAFDLLMAEPSATKLQLLDRNDDFNGAIIPAHLERTGLAIVGQDRQGNPRVDFTQRKMVRRVWIKAEGGPFTVRVGSQEIEEGPVTWSTGQTFTPGVDRYIDPATPVSGLLIAIRFESNSGVQWSVVGYDLELEILGGF